MLKPYMRVRLLTDKYKDEGVPSGGIGYIIEVYDGAFEVEFSAPTGTTIAQLVLRPTEIEPAELQSNAPEKSSLGVE